MERILKRAKSLGFVVLAVVLLAQCSTEADGGADGTPDDRPVLTAGDSPVMVDAGDTATDDATVVGSKKVVFFTGAAGLELTEADFAVTGGGRIDSVSVAGDVVTIIVTFPENKSVAAEFYSVVIPSSSERVSGDASVQIIHKGTSGVVPSLASVLYVRDTGSDTNGTGSADAPFATLAHTYDVAIASPAVQTIVVLSDLTTENKPMTLNGHGGTPRKITITGNTQQRMLTKAAGTDAPIVRVEAGAKVVFRNIFINGRPQYHVPDDKATETIYGPGLVILCEGPENGPSFVLWPDTEVTLDTGVTVTGRRDPPPPMFDRTDDYWPGSGGGVVIHGGKLTMEEGSKIINCTSEIGGGVFIGGQWYYDASAIFVMNGGEISGNYSDLKGAAVFIVGFTSNNVTPDFIKYIDNPCKFIMNGGTITRNECETSPRDNEKYDSSAIMSLYFYNIFTMTGGTIVNNKAGPSGAGVKLVATNQSPGIEAPYVDYVFTYPDGAISGNTPNDFLYKNIPVPGYY